MDIKQQLLESLKNASLEEILDRKDIDTLPWFWINRDIFTDILKNISGFDYYTYERQVDKLLEDIEDKEFIEGLREEIERRDFIRVSQRLFAQLDEDYRVVEEISTWVFLKEDYYNKLWIKLFQKMEWVLKAMAINTYQGLDTAGDSLEETYREFFENNTRIIEEIVDQGEYSAEVGKWIWDRKEDSLTFYKHNKPFYTWGQGDAEFKFDELQLP